VTAEGLTKHVSYFERTSVNTALLQSQQRNHVQQIYSTVFSISTDNEQKWTIMCMSHMKRRRQYTKYKSDSKCPCSKVTQASIIVYAWLVETQCQTVHYDISVSLYTMW